MKNSIDYIQAQTRYFKPQIGLILGSGLGELAEEIDGFKLDYEEIPGFPKSTVEGHAGKLVMGRLCDKKVIAMQGRFHFYEGHSMDSVTYGIRVFKELGVNTIIVTNAAGGIHTKLNEGDLMIIDDHINMMGTNPLLSPLYEGQQRFLGMGEAYNPKLVEFTKACAKKVNVEVKTGVYAGLTGPIYETPAEVKMLSKLGADAVGMSTVPEVILARYFKMNVIGISCITNMAAGINNSMPTHAEVIETAARVKTKFKSLVKTMLEEM